MRLLLSTEKRTQDTGGYPRQTIRIFTPSGVAALPCNTHVITRVAMELGRHSISSDISPAIHDYFSKHMANWSAQEAADEDRVIPYRVLEKDNLEGHPLFLGLGKQAGLTIKALGLTGLRARK